MGMVTPSDDERSVMPAGIVTPEDDAELSTWDKVKKRAPTPNDIARFGYQTAGMLAGGAGGFVSPIPGGTILLGAAGYAGGQKVADFMLGDRQISKPESSVPRQALDELKQSGQDFGVGIGYALLGPLFRAGGWGITKTGEIVGSLWKKGLKGSLEVASDAFVKKNAANKLAENITRGNKTISDQMIKNVVESERLESEMPGVKFNIGETGGDPNLLSLAKAKSTQPGYGIAKGSEAIADRNVAIREYTKNNITGKGDVSDFLTAIESKGNMLSENATIAGRKADETAVKMAGRSEQEAGRGILDKARAQRTASSIKAEGKYNKVPDELETESAPLWDEVKKMFGNYDELTQFLNTTPTKAMGKIQTAMGTDTSGRIPIPETRAELIKAIDAGLVDAKGNLISSVGENPVRNLTMKEMKDFRSHVTTAKRAAEASTSAGSDELAWKYGEIKRAIGKSLDETVKKGGGEGVQALKEATDYYKYEHVPKYKHGATEYILRKKGTGEQKVVDSSIGGNYFKSGKGAAEAADDYIRTFGNDAESRLLIRDYAAQSLLKDARHTITGDIDTKAVQRWQYQHQEALRRLGLEKEFGSAERGMPKSAQTSLEKASLMADRAREIEAQFNKGALARALNDNPDRAIESMLMVGTGKRQSIKRLKEMVGIAKASTDSKAALDGLRAGIGNYFEKQTAVTTMDLAKGDMQSYYKVHRFWNDMRKTFEESGLYSSDQIKAWNNVHKALQIVSSQARPHAGRRGSVVSDIMGRGIAGAASVASGHLGTYGITKAAYSMIDKEITNRIDEAVIRAIYDPRYAEELMGFATNSMKMPLNKAYIIAERRIGRLNEAIGVKEVIRGQTPSIMGSAVTKGVIPHQMGTPTSSSNSNDPWGLRGK